jgi:hypothetical protein
MVEQDFNGEFLPDKAGDTAQYIADLEAERDALRDSAPWDAWKAAETRVRELEAALRAWREAESSPDCVACCTLDAALADNIPRG